MSITTFAELQTAVGARFNRSDMTSVLPEFIASAEVDINARLSLDPVRPMMTGTSGTISAETLAMPANLINVIYLEISDGTTTWEVPYYAPENVSQLQPLSDAFINQVDTLFGVSTSPIRAYTIIGSDFRFFPVPASSVTYSLRYWLKVPALSVSNTTNWLLTAHHTAYLYGAMAHACVWTGDFENVEGYQSAFSAAMDGVIASYPTRTDSTPLRSEISPRHILSPNSWMNQ